MNQRDNKKSLWNFADDDLDEAQKLWFYDEDLETISKILKIVILI